jgi:hypothetical protein
MKYITRISVARQRLQEGEEETIPLHRDCGPTLKVVG